MQQLLNRIANPVITALLRSPLHGLASRQMLLVTVTGRRTGRRMTFPVGYTRSGDLLTVVSTPAHRWWHNLRGGAEVGLLLRGRAARGWAEVLTPAAEEPMARRVAIQIQLR